MGRLQQVRQRVRRLLGAADSRLAPNRDPGCAATPLQAAPLPAAAGLSAPLVVGLFTDLSDAGQALTNLAEAGYAPAGIAVVALQPDRVRTVTDTAGPLAGVPPAAVPAAAVPAYQAALAAGAVALVVAPPVGAEAAAAEVLTDQHATHVQLLRGGAEAP